MGSSSKPCAKRRHHCSICARILVRSQRRKLNVQPLISVRSVIIVSLGRLITVVVSSEAIEADITCRWKSKKRRIESTLINHEDR